MPRAADPTREVALIALSRSASPNDTLKEVIAYAFDQLCWTQGEPELEQLLAGLRAKLEETT